MCNSQLHVDGGWCCRRTHISAWKPTKCAHYKRTVHTMCTRIMISFLFCYYFSSFFFHSNEILFVYFCFLNVFPVFPAAQWHSSLNCCALIFFFFLFCLKGFARPSCPVCHTKFCTIIFMYSWHEIEKWMWRMI